MSRCDLHASGVIELYFYDELDPAEHARLDLHVSGCGECRRALEDLQTIRLALAGCPDVAAPADGDWAPFMARLDEAVRREQTAASLALHARVRATGSRGAATFRTRHSRRPVVGYLAMAALLALVTIGVLLAWRTAERGGSARLQDEAAIAGTAPGAAEIATADPAFVRLSEQHFERSKLVLLGLTTKDPADASAADWEYERELAERLLNDTRLYRLAAEERGLTSLARVMQDLELVLLQTSMSEGADASALEQLQRLIRKRDLVTKIELVTTTAGI